MSILIVSMVLYTDMPDLEYPHIVKKRSGETKQKNIRVSASVAKTILVSLADQANDEGFGAYPGITRLEIKTSLSRPTVTRGLKALRFWEFTNLEGVSRRGTNEYRIFLDKLRELQNPISSFYNAEVVNSVYQDGKPSLLAVVNPVYQDSKLGLPESSLNVLKTSLNISANAETKSDQTKTKSKQLKIKKPKPTRKKSQSIIDLELLEGIFADVRGVASPDWSNGKGAGNQTNWRSPLRALLKECEGDVQVAGNVINAVVSDYLRGKKDPRYPMVVPRSFEKHFIAQAIETKNFKTKIERPDWEQLIIDNKGQVFDWARDMVTGETEIGAWIIANPTLNRVPLELLTK